MFFRNFRKASVFFFSSCIYLMSVDSPSSSSVSLSRSSSPAIDIESIDPTFTHFAHDNDTRVAYDADFDFSFSILAETTDAVQTPNVILLNPFDFSDLDTDVVEVVFPALLAIAKTIRKDPSAVAHTVAVECLKAIFYKGGLKMQLGLELGEHVETIDKALTGTILRLAIELIFGLLAGLFASSRKQLRSFKASLGFLSRGLDVCAFSQLNVAALLLILAADIRPAIFNVVSDGILAACFITFVLQFRTRTHAPPPPPPPPRKKKRWYQHR
ncbi:hypothetical protein B0H13DRAFT_2315535 [Mycena leptocephala]|nr:hypothetical protein B0H13DRAFT_2315535 [Mycena leptocephala]